MRNELTWAKFTFFTLHTLLPQGPSSTPAISPCDAADPHSPRGKLPPLLLPSSPLLTSLP